MPVLIRISIFFLLFGVAISKAYAGSVIVASDVAVESVDRNYPWPKTTFASYYLQGQYRISQEWDLVLRYDALFIDKNDRSGELNHALFPVKPAHAFYSKDWTLGVGWAPTS